MILVLLRMMCQLESVGQADSFGCGFRRDRPGNFVRGLQTTCQAIRHIQADFVAQTLRGAVANRRSSDHGEVAGLHAHDSSAWDWGFRFYQHPEFAYIDGPGANTAVGASRHLLPGEVQLTVQGKPIVKALEFCVGSAGLNGVRNLFGLDGGC